MTKMNIFFLGPIYTYIVHLYAEKNTKHNNKLMEQGEYGIS